MRAATVPVQRPADARLLIVAPDGGMQHAWRARLADYLQAGDLLIANDAATIPASLHGIHRPSGGEIEIRLVARPALSGDEGREFTAVVFGAGDYHTRTEDRPPPPRVQPGDRFELGPLGASVTGLLDHPRLLVLRFDGTSGSIWAGIAQHGKPIQYAHVDQPLALWDVWTRVASLPVAFEPPSAGFVLDWQLLARLQERRIGFATLTLAAGISSTGDAALDARLPLEEPYHLPEATVREIGCTRARRGRIVALGTTVTRALEHAASRDGTLSSGPGLATQRIGPETRLRVVDAILTGVHPPESSHYQLLRAFASDGVLGRVTDTLDRHGYRDHEFGDSVLLSRQRPHGTGAGYPTFASFLHRSANSSPAGSPNSAEP